MTDVSVSPVSDPAPSLDVTDERVAAPFRVLSLSDLRGLALLGCDATLGVTDVVEQLHGTIGAVALPLGRPRTARTRGITGAVYATVRGSTRLVARGIDVALRRFEAPEPATAVSPAREATLAAVNGVWGDHLAARGNPLAIPMAIRVAGRAVAPTREGLAAAFPAPSSRLALFVHGLCMNDLQWQRGGHHHAPVLAALGFTPLMLHYNSGLHVSDNGAHLAALLDAVVARWPCAVDELVIVGHSMGGLVARAACHVADERGLRWRAHLTTLVCLGTPHHGAMLERGGHLVDSVMGISPYAAPFARLGKARSAGITDLRFGNVRRDDWDGRSAHAQGTDDRRITPLPDGVQVVMVAATVAPQPRGLRHAVIGDGLVTVASAFGEHRDPQRALAVPASHKRLVTNASHWDLLNRPEVAAALHDWLGGRAARVPPAT